MRNHPIAYLVGKRLDVLSEQTLWLQRLLPLVVLLGWLAQSPEVVMLFGIFPLLIYCGTGISKAVQLWTELRHGGGLEELLMTGLSPASMVDTICATTLRWLIRPMAALAALMGLTCAFTAEGPPGEEALLGMLVSVIVFLQLSYMFCVALYGSQLFMTWGLGAGWSLRSVVVGLVLNVACWPFLGLMAAAGVLFGPPAIFLAMLLMFAMIPVMARYGAVLGLKHRDTLDTWLGKLTVREKTRFVSPSLNLLWSRNPVAAAGLAPLATRNGWIVLGYLLISSLVPVYFFAFDLMITGGDLHSELLAMFLVMSLFAVAATACRPIFTRLQAERQNGGLELLKGTGLTSSQLLNGWAAGGVFRAIWAALVGMPLVTLVALQLGPVFLACWYAGALLTTLFAAEATLYLSFVQRLDLWTVLRLMAVTASWTIAMGLLLAVSVGAAAAGVLFTLWFSLVKLRRQNLKVLADLGFSARGY